MLRKFVWVVSGIPACTTSHQPKNHQQKRQISASGRGGGPWRGVWAQRGVGGFGYDRNIFPDSLTWFPRGAWKWTYCNWHESFPCYRWFGTTAHGKHACSGLRNSLFLLGFAFCVRIANYIDAGWKNSLFKITEGDGRLRSWPLVLVKPLLCLFFLVTVKILHGSLLIKSSVAQSPFTSLAVSWDNLRFLCKPYYNFTLNRMPRGAILLCSQSTELMSRCTQPFTWGCPGHLAAHGDIWEL